METFIFLSNNNGNSNKNSIYLIRRRTLSKLAKFAAEKKFVKQIPMRGTFKAAGIKLRTC